MATITLRATKGSPLTNNEVDANFNNLNTELGTKFDAADFTGSNILTQIKTVDGALSGLDADTVDGYNQDTANTANTLVRRDANGDFSAGVITATNFVGTYGGAAAITSGTITGITDLAIADGGTAASTAAGARTNLGLAIGTDVQAHNATLDGIASTNPVADQLIYSTGTDVFATTGFSSAARGVVSASSLSAMRTALGLAIGSNVQPFDADLSGISSLTTTGMVFRTGNGTFSARTLSAGTGVNITNADGSGNVTISTGQDVTTTGSVQFGSLGIGTVASGTTGEIRATNQITSYYSDVRLKENVTNIESALEKVEKLNGVTYTTNELAESFGFINKERQVGVLAQDVKEVLPEAVKPAPFDIMLYEGTEISKSGENYMTVQYEKLVPLLIEAIKDLSAQVKELKESK